MLLQALREYSSRRERDGDTQPLPPMYQEVPIKWVIDLDAKGGVRGIVTQVGAEERETDRGKRMLAPHVMRSVAIRPKLLADNGEYVLGFPRERSRTERVRKCHQAFVEEVKKCAETTGEPTVQAVLRFLEALRTEDLHLPENFDPSMNLTFRVGSMLPIHLPKVQEYWADTALKGRGGGVMQCLVCGRREPAVKRHEVKVKGIPGGQVSGTALISANENAFESYGLEASLVAPTCQACSEAFGNAANELIRGENTHLYVGPLVYLFWAKKEVGFSPATLLRDPDAGEVEALLKAAWRGRREAVTLDATPFYSTALAASGGRVAVRDWIDTTVGEVQSYLARYFNLQRIVDRSGKEGRYLGIFALSAATLAATVRDARRELPANVPRVLLRLALRGGALPSWLLFQAVKRNRAEQRVTRPRAALIKMALLSREGQPEEKEAMVELDTTNREPAYLCGRLLAVLEQVQQAALGNISATIVDRYYGAASSAPASVFGRLLTGAQAHLGKLRKDRRGAYVTLQKTLEEVQGGLDRFPKTLPLEAQGLFALGYYHQRARGWGKGQKGQSDETEE